MLSKIQSKVIEWRDQNYKTENYSTIKEFLQFQKENGTLKYLRQPQFEAIETYFYLRIVEIIQPYLNFTKNTFYQKKIYVKLLE
jgi:hypothetical protein